LEVTEILLDGSALATRQGGYRTENIPALADELQLGYHGDTVRQFVARNSAECD